MNVTGVGSPSCRELRQLLGVYVVGAIDPAERALVDEHLATCSACRDELVGLAGLPAMLGRVPATDVARLDSAVIPLPEQPEPSPELLNSLLRKVAGRRRTRMWRGAAAVAAAAFIAAGGTAGILSLTGSHASPGTVWNAASATNPATHVRAVVDYTKVGTGTDMRVRVAGIPSGTWCHFWVITRNGRSTAGLWMVASTGSALSPW